jgi:hypothetical protein
VVPALGGDDSNEGFVLLVRDSALKRILPAFAEDHLLADIDAADITEYQKARLSEARRPSNRTVNMEIGVLRKVLIHTGHWARLKDDVRMLDERTDVGRALTADQENILREGCGRSVSRALLPFVMTCPQIPHAVL